MRGWLVLLAACGRIDFDPLANPVAAPLGPDATIPDRVLFLPFNNTYSDLGNQRTGVCDPNCPSFAPGHDATGVKFDGTQCLRYDDVAPFDTPTFTIAVWVDATAYSQHGTYLEKSYADTTTTDNSYQLWSDDGNNVQFVTYSSGSANDPQFYQKAAPQAWQFLVATFDGTTKKLYVDGVQKASNAAAPVKFDVGAIRIGCDFDNGAANTFVTGSLDDVFIYTRALSAAEVLTLTGM